MTDRSPTHQMTGQAPALPSEQTGRDSSRSVAGCSLPSETPACDPGDNPARPPVTDPPALSYVRAGEGLELGNHAFLKPLPPCCSMIASPYWARIIGDVCNNRNTEVLIKVVATVFDHEGSPVGAHEDFMVLDAGQKSEFDIKIDIFYENVYTYGLETIETEDF